MSRLVVLPRVLNIMAGALRAELMVFLLGINSGIGLMSVIVDQKMSTLGPQFGIEMTRPSASACPECPSAWVADGRLTVYVHRHGRIHRVVGLTV